MIGQSWLSTPRSGENFHLKLLPLANLECSRTHRYLVGVACGAVAYAAGVIAYRKIARWKHERALRVAIADARLKRDTDIQALQRRLSAAKIGKAERDRIVSLSAKDLLGETNL